MGATLQNEIGKCGQVGMHAGGRRQAFRQIAVAVTG